MNLLDRAAKALEDARAEEERTAAADREQRLAVARNAAVSATVQRLQVRTEREQWDWLPAPDGFEAQAVYAELEDGVLVASRPRSVMQGDTLLVALVRDDAGELVASRTEIKRLADLPIALEDARARAGTFSTEVSRAGALGDDADGGEKGEEVPGEVATLEVADPVPYLERIADAVEAIASEILVGLDHLLSIAEHLEAMPKRGDYGGIVPTTAAE